MSLQVLVFVFKRGTLDLRHLTEDRFHYLWVCQCYNTPRFRVNSNVSGLWTSSTLQNYTSDPFFYLTVGNPYYG